MTSIPEPWIASQISLFEEEDPEDDGYMTWAYVSLMGDTEDGTYCEAVAVTLENENGKDVIRKVEWGRP